MKSFLWDEDIFLFELYAPSLDTTLFYKSFIKSHENTIRKRNAIVTWILIGRRLRFPEEIVQMIRIHIDLFSTFEWVIPSRYKKEVIVKQNTTIHQTVFAHPIEQKERNRRYQKDIKQKLKMKIKKL